MMALRLGYTALCLALVAGSLPGCGESNRAYMSRLAAYGFPLNAAREKKLIPVIPQDWRQRADRSGAAWENPNLAARGTTPMHQYKFLTFADRFRDTGALVEETDHYASGRTWMDPAEGTITEYIRITYSYENERQCTSPWQVDAVLQRNGTFIPTNPSLQEAEAILTEWGIPRLPVQPTATKTAQPAPGGAPSPRAGPGAPRP